MQYAQSTKAFIATTLLGFKTEGNDEKSNVHFFGQVLICLFSGEHSSIDTEDCGMLTILSLFGIFGPKFCEQDIFYRDTEDNDEKTVERSPELSAGNGGELDLLKMDFRETLEI